MAEEEAKKDEEKLEFTLESETLGYIALEQARVLALQHVWDNRDFHGRNRRGKAFQVHRQVFPPTGDTPRSALNA